MLVRLQVGRRTQGSGFCGLAEPIFEAEGASETQLALPR